MVLFFTSIKTQILKVTFYIMVCRFPEMYVFRKSSVLASHHPNKQTSIERPAVSLTLAWE